MKVAFRSNMLRLVKSNFTIYRMILIAIVIYFEGDIELSSVIKNFIWLFIIPLAVSLIALFITYLYDRKIEKTLNEGYYRDIIEKISPVELTYIDDYCIESEKDFMATLLELQLKKKIEITNAGIKIINKKESNLTNHEKMVLNELKNNTGNEKNTKTFEERFDEGATKFIENIISFFKPRMKKDEFREGLIEDLHKSQLIDLTKEEKLHNLTSRLIAQKNKHVVLLIILFIIMATNDEELIFYLAYFISFFVVIKLITTFIKFNEKKVAKIENKFLHVAASTLCGFGLYWLFILGICVFFTVLIVLEDYRVAQIFATIFKYIIIAISIAFEIISTYLIITNQQLSKKGKEIKTKLIGLKMFLADYSNMKQKELNEAPLWDEYIIYAIILNQNKKINKQLKRILRIQFPGIK